MRLGRSGSATILMFLSGATLFAADCTAPAPMQAELRARPNVRTYTELGSWFDDRHQYECAIRAYRSALKLNPTSAQILNLLATSQYSSGNVKDAATTLRQSITVAPGDLDARLRLAATLEQLQRNDEAKAEWQAALKIDPHSIAALDGMSTHLIAEGNYGAVISLLRTAPRVENLVLDLVQAYGLSGMLAEAKDTLTTALKESPSSFPLTNALAITLVNQGFLQEAEQLTEKFAHSHPENLDAQKAYLRMLVVNSSNAALPLAHALLNRSPHDDYVLYVSGMLERQNGDLVAARDHLRESVAVNPNSYNSHYNLGLVLAKLGDAEDALEQFEKAIALGGTEPEIRLQLSKALKALGKNDEAQKQLDAYRQAAEAEANQSVVQGKSALAEKELNSGDPKKAVTLYREALAVSPSDAALNYKLSVALDKAADIAGEQAALERAVELDPDLAVAHNQLGYLASRRGDLASAEQHFREAVRAAPAYTEAWISLAATLAMESKLSEAKKAVAEAVQTDPTNPQAAQLQQDLNSR